MDVLIQFLRKIEIRSVYSLEKRVFFRCVSSSASGSEIMRQEQCSYKENEGDSLMSKIFTLKLAKRSVISILQTWVRDGNTVTASELRHISKELKKSHRYKHALEISEWMVSHGEFHLLNSDYATRIDLMNKVFGIDAAERYFTDLPPNAKTSETYTALLHSYASAKMIEKTEELYDKIKRLNLPVTTLIYNEMMTLYMSLGQIKKIPAVVEEMNHHKIPFDIFTCNLWISSCVAAGNLDEMRRIFHEMENSSSASDEWARYIAIANVYITAGLVGEELSAVSETEISRQREWVTYDFLIILHASLGNKDKIGQIWNCLKIAKPNMTYRSYVCVISSYLVLGYLKEAGEIIEQWKRSTVTEFDFAACCRIVDAIASVGLSDVAAHFHHLLKDTN